MSINETNNTEATMKAMVLITAAGSETLFVTDETSTVDRQVRQDLRDRILINGRVFSQRLQCQVKVDRHDAVTGKTTRMMVEIPIA